MALKIAGCRSSHMMGCKFCLNSLPRTPIEEPVTSASPMSAQVPCMLIQVPFDGELLDRLGKTYEILKPRPQQMRPVCPVDFARLSMSGHPWSRS